MTFFYDLNKKLAGIADKPATSQLNERDEGKPGKNFAKIAKGAAERYGSKEAGERVAGAVRAKLAKQGKLEEADLDEGFVDTVKSGAQAALSAIGSTMGHGSDEDMIKDLQKKAGVPVTGKVQPQPGQNPTMAGQKPMAEADMEEGNEFSGALDAARDSGAKTFKVDGREYPVREDGTPMTPKQKKFAALAEPKDKITFADKIAGAKQEVDEMLGDVAAEAMKSAVSKMRGTEEMDEGWDDMLKDVEKRTGQMKTGEKKKTSKGEVEKTSTGIRHTRSYDAKTGETDTGDEETSSGEKRGRGRPKKDKAPERVTAKAYKHKGGRKMSKEEIEEAISALEEAGYSVQERKLSSSEKEEREDIVKGMKKNKGEFKKRYGKRGEEVMYATATKMAKERGPGNPDRKKKEKTEETTVAGSVAPAEGGKAKKGGSIIGKGIYDSLNRDLEAMISESMNVSVNMAQDEHGQPHKNITVSAEGEAAEQLAQLLNLAGMSAQGDDHGCGCDTDPCSCESEELDENQPDWPTNTEVTGDDDPHLNRWAGGLNKPKETGQTTIPVVNRDPARGSYGPAEMAEAKDLGMKLYAELKSFKG